VLNSRPFLYPFGPPFLLGEFEDRSKKDDEEPAFWTDLVVPSGDSVVANRGQIHRSICSAGNIASKLIDQVKPIVRLVTYQRPIDYFD